MEFKVCSRQQMRFSPCSRGSWVTSGTCGARGSCRAFRSCCACCRRIRGLLGDPWSSARARTITMPATAGYEGTARPSRRVRDAVGRCRLLCGLSLLTGSLSMVLNATGMDDRVPTVRGMVFGSRATTSKCASGQEARPAETRSSPETRISSVNSAQKSKSGVRTTQSPRVRVLRNQTIFLRVFFRE